MAKAPSKGPGREHAHTRTFAALPSGFIDLESSAEVDRFIQELRTHLSRLGAIEIPYDNQGSAYIEPGNQDQWAARTEPVMLSEWRGAFEGGALSAISHRGLRVILRGQSKLREAVERFLVWIEEPDAESTPEQTIYTFGAKVSGVPQKENPTPGAWMDSLQALIELEARLQAALAISTPRLFSVKKFTEPADECPVTLVDWEDQGIKGLKVVIRGNGPMQVIVKRILRESVDDVLPDAGSTDAEQTYTIAAPTFLGMEDELDA